MSESTREKLLCDIIRAIQEMDIVKLQKVTAFLAGMEVTGKTNAADPDKEGKGP